MSGRQFVGAGGAQQVALGKGGQRAAPGAAVAHRILHFLRRDAEGFGGEEQLIQFPPVVGIRQLLPTTQIDLPVGEHRKRALGDQGKLFRAFVGRRVAQCGEAAQIAVRQHPPHFERALQCRLFHGCQGQGFARESFGRIFLNFADRSAQHFEDGQALGR
jgi:hypothetical protein